MHFFPLASLLEEIASGRGEAFLIWSVRAAVVFYLLRMFIAVRAGLVSRVPTRPECVLWTIGCVAYLVHVFCAFEFSHQWSHAEAWQHTADETARMIGVRRGEGLWVNYVFSLVWLIDCSRLIRSNTSQQITSRRWDITIHLFMAFIVFNATVVFGPNLYRWLTAPLAIVFVVIWRKRDIATK